MLQDDVNKNNYISFPAALNTTVLPPTVTTTATFRNNVLIRTKNRMSNPYILLSGKIHLRQHRVELIKARKEMAYVEHVT